MVRFADNIQCAKHDPKTESSEGIMVIYKKNIRPHTFKAYTYSKELIYQRSYAYIRTSYLLGSSRETVAMPEWEVHTVNDRGMCYSSYSRVMNGAVFVAYNEDSYVNETMRLFEDDLGSSNSRRYISVKERYHKYGSTWLYKETCTLNCIVAVVTARSRYPYDFFVLASGIIVDGSPFYDGKNNKTFRENARKLRVMYNYSMVLDFAAVNSQRRVVPKMAFFERADTIIAWEIVDEVNATCQLQQWEVVDRAVKTNTTGSVHFTSRSLTATFVSSGISLNKDNAATSCIREEANRTLMNVFSERYADTHEKDGDVSFFETSGGLYVAWQGVKPKSLAELERVQNLSSHTAVSRRRRRSADTVNSTHTDITYAQLQFTYDTLRDYINRALSDIADAWCRDQKRTAEVLKELSKINPSSMLTAIYDRPVAARLAGDVIALANCIEVDQDTVQVLRDMRLRDNDGHVVECYSRPVVRFRFVNNSDIQSGQLGENNEILLGTHRTEKCQLPSYKVFVAGDRGYEYRDYKFMSEKVLDDIDVVNTMISLNIEPLENADFRVLQLYTQEELKSSNVFSLEDIMREYNAFKQRVHFLDTKVNDRIPAYLKGLDDFMSGLGQAGKGFGVVVGAVGGVVASVASGILSVFSNPFGTCTVALLIVGLVAIAVLLYQRQKTVMARPVESLFPYVSQHRVDVTTATQTLDDAPPPYVSEGADISYKSPSRSSEGDAVENGTVGGYTEEDALRMLQAIGRLDRQKRPEKKSTQTSGRGILDRMQRRKYERLPSEDSDTAPARV